MSDTWVTGTNQRGGRGRCSAPRLAFDRFVALLDAWIGDLPAQVGEAEVAQHVAKGHRKHAVRALRWLGCIDDRSVPTTVLRALVDPARRKDALRQLFEVHYGGLASAVAAEPTWATLEGFFNYTGASARLAYTFARHLGAEVGQKLPAIPEEVNSRSRTAAKVPQHAVEGDALDSVAVQQHRYREALVALCEQAAAEGRYDRDLFARTERVVMQQ